jgi:FlaA1/EpsC-like NDP-sugar epimerase
MSRFRVHLPHHRIWQLLVDAGLVAAAWTLAFQLRFDQGLPVFYQTLYDRTIWIVVPVKVAVFVLFGFSNRWWRYFSSRDVWRTTVGVVAACVVADMIVYFAQPVGSLRLPRSIVVLDLLITLALIGGARMLARTLIERPNPLGIVARGREVLVVGAGNAAQLVVRELQRRPGFTPIGLVDDDPKKRNMRLEGVRVLGTTDELARILHDNRPDEVLIAIPSAPGSLRAKVVEIARAERIPVRTLPGLSELVAGDVDLAAQIRPVQVEDVLGREQIEVDLREIATYCRDKTVLVTGAGGSIGSELCRQIARVGCQRIVILDHAETPLFEIERELVDDRHFPPVVPVIGDVKNRDKMQRVFERYRPDVVFHAAAYKHVPLMEANPLEAVRNNSLATRTLAQVAAEAGTEVFVLISTDKAVAPKTVMGQSKALCEWIIETLGHRPDVKTRFVAVRFGNVLGSSGSVIPIFRKQIARGGPVTVTHPEMTRFFMTIPEAVSLVVQAGALGGRGEVYVLDMGEPVKIVDLARNMIRLSGKEPDTDIKIEFVGVRAGEKLHEELVAGGEDVSATRHPKISQLTRPAVDPAWLDEQIAVLERLVTEGDTLELVAKLGQMMREPKRVGSTGEFLALMPSDLARGGESQSPPVAPPPIAGPGAAAPLPEDTGSHAPLS